MNHYIYYSYEEWGRGYIGVKSSENPLTDGYFGSYTDTAFQPDHKIVIAEFSSREEAQSAEILLHEYFEVSNNPHFANRCKATSTGFLNTGHSPEAREKMKVSQKQRFKENPGTFTGRSHSEKTIRLMQVAARAQPPELVESRVAAMHSPESREKARQTLKGKPWSSARRKAHEEQKSHMISQ